MYEFTDEMGEISGFGGSYELDCRAMLKAGLEWLDENPQTDPQFHGYKNVYGIISEDNDDAKALTKATMDAKIIKDNGKTIRCGDEATGAMHQAVISSIFWIRKNGWQKYVETMSKETPKERELVVAESPDK